MGAFYVSIIFVGILLIIGSLIFIAMDKVNGKDFFREFDRKKDEMFNLIQDSEEMIQELNKMSDYVVTMISEKNQEYFEKVNNSVTYTPSIPVRIKPIPPVPVTNVPELELTDKAETVIREEVASESQEALQSKAPELVSEIVEEAETKEAETEAFKENTKEDTDYREKHEVNKWMSNITERLTETDANKSRLVLNPKRREVLKMIEQGMSNDEIADKIKIGKGEIDLIRGLSK